MAPLDDIKKGEEEDSPVIKELKEIDDQYLALDKQYEKERQALQRKFTEKQKPLLEKRAARLADGGADAANTGTPAVKGFWGQALMNHPALEDLVEEWDMPVLEYLKDVTDEFLDPEDMDKGFKINFHFIENPYFSNAVLSKEYHTSEESPYTGDINVNEIKSTVVDWKDGKDVTVELVQKKVKGGGAKKAKEKAKAKMEPRNSFFRHFLRSLKKGDSRPEDLPEELIEQLCDDEDGDDEEIVEMLLDNDHDVGCALRDNVIPFAVRWYTGEAAPSDDGESSEEEDPEDDSEDDDSEEESSASPAGKKGQGKKKGGAGGAGAKKDGEKQEECKQQ